VNEMAVTSASLTVRRTIRAEAERLFAAWTEPGHLRNWWGPGQVRCTSAEVDLRVGGHYRIGNNMPDGKTIFIFGEFEQIERPRLLVYTWRIEPAPPGDSAERVTVRFEPNGSTTEVIVVHELIPDVMTRDRHEAGWLGCLGKLETWVRAEGERAS
jgi:uncharacterized protein YndB with AHSA1/START domain